MFLFNPHPLLHPAILRPSAHVIYSHKNVSGLFIYLFICLGFCTNNKARQVDLYFPSGALMQPQPPLRKGQKGDFVPFAQVLVLLPIHTLIKQIIHSNHVITRAGNHYGEKRISTFSGDIKEELWRLMMVHMEGKQWRG